MLVLPMLSAPLATWAHSLKVAELAELMCSGNNGKVQQRLSSCGTRDGYSSASRIPENMLVWRGWMEQTLLVSQKD
eukprot:6283283-Amphidinium_carterae.1